MEIDIVRLFFVVLVFLAPIAWAEEDESRILTIIEAIDRGWENADGEPFRAHFLDFEGARYVESGGQNVGLTDLIEHHVEPEGDALQLELTFNDPQIHIEDDFAWAVMDTDVKATVLKDGRKIHNRGYQTIIFRKIDGDWKVLHTHSSSRPVKPD